MLIVFLSFLCCFRYHKGTDFQANHNLTKILSLVVVVVLDTTKVQIFKQITTRRSQKCFFARCFRYHKGTDFQANHNICLERLTAIGVVLDTTKVQIFKQITTKLNEENTTICCFRYHKGTDFQANHNNKDMHIMKIRVVLDTTKVQIFKQITT